VVGVGWWVVGGDTLPHLVLCLLDFDVRSINQAPGPSGSSSSSDIHRRVWSKRNNRITPTYGLVWEGH